MVMLLDADDDSLWPVDRMRVYLEMIKSRNAKGPPPIAPAATALLQRYFNWQRENRSKLNQSRRTIRMLESLIRLAQAHSLLLGKEEVTLEDAVVSVSLMDMTCGEAASTSGPLSASFLCYVAVLHSGLPDGYW